MNSTGELKESYCGFIGSTYDALVLFEACISGEIRHVSRRPHDREREHVIKSGKVFIYEENTSGIKRWTDGISWSPSRILGNFLIYRQLVKPFGPGEKKKALKKSKAGPTGISKNNQSNNNNGQHKDNPFQGVGNRQPSGGSYGRAGTISAETERALIGSLTDSYDFLEDGLVKKTISVTCDDVTHHLVSYYTVADAASQTFLEPSKDPRFCHIRPRPSLLTAQNFRSPIEDVDPVDRPMYPHSTYDMTSQSIAHNYSPIMTAPEAHSSYGGTAAFFYNGNYAMQIPSTLYETNLPAYALTVGYTTQYSPTPSIYPAAQRAEQYDTDYQQRYIIASGSSSDGSRAQMLTTVDMQGGALIFQRRDSEDSGVSMSMDNVINDSSYNQSQSGCYGFPQDLGLPTNIAANQKALPCLSQADFYCQAVYDRLASNGPSDSFSIDGKELWLMGNAGAGHGHCLHT